MAMFKRLPAGTAALLILVLALHEVPIVGDVGRSGDGYLTLLGSIVQKHLRMRNNRHMG